MFKLTGQFITLGCSVALLLLLMLMLFSLLYCFKILFLKIHLWGAGMRVEDMSLRHHCVPHPLSPDAALKIFSVEVQSNIGSHDGRTKVIPLHSQLADEPDGRGSV